MVVCWYTPMEGMDTCMLGMISLSLRLSSVSMMIWSDELRCIASFFLWFVDFVMSLASSNNHAIQSVIYTSHKYTVFQAFQWWRKCIWAWWNITQWEKITIMIIRREDWMDCDFFGNQSGRQGFHFSHIHVSLKNIYLIYLLLNKGWYESKWN